MSKTQEKTYPGNSPMERWVAALESGDFEQGRQYLRTSEGFCCLGVACELYRRETGEGKWDEMGYFLPPNDVPQAAKMPDVVREWFDLPKSFGGLGYVDGMSLAGMNDDGASFSKIAAVIKEQFLGQPPNATPSAATSEKKDESAPPAGEKEGGRGVRVRVFVRDCERVPRGYAIGQIDYDRRGGIAYPIGIHWIARAWAAIGYWALVHRPSKSEMALRKIVKQRLAEDMVPAKSHAWEQGFRSGWRGHETCLETITESGANATEARWRVDRVKLLSLEHLNPYTGPTDQSQPVAPIAGTESQSLPREAEQKRSEEGR